MRRAMMLAGGALVSLGLVLAASPVLAHPYGPEDEHVNPSSNCRCDGCSDDWGSGGSPGYYADGRYYSSYPGRRHHRYYRGYGGGYGYQGGYGGYGQGGYPPPGYGQGGYGPGGGGYPQGGYPPQGYGQPGPYDQGGYGGAQNGGYYDQGPQSGYSGPGGR